MLKQLIIALAILSLIGCSSRPIRDAVFTDDGYVIAARTKSVEVQAVRSEPVRTRAGAWLDIWYIRVVNTHKKKEWCASIEWRSKDYDINVPNVWFYLPPNSQLNIGAAVQEVWNFIGTDIALDDAAFSVFHLNLLKPNKGKCVANPT